MNVTSDKSLWLSVFYFQLEEKKIDNRKVVIWKLVFSRAVIENRRWINSHEFLFLFHHFQPTKLSKISYQTYTFNSLLSITLDYNQLYVWLSIGRNFPRNFINQDGSFSQFWHISIFAFDWSDGTRLIDKKKRKTKLHFTIVKHFLLLLLIIVITTKLRGFFLLHRVERFFVLYFFKISKG